MFAVKKRRLLLIVAAVAASWAGTASFSVARADEASVKTELEASYKIAGDALQAKDFETFFGLETDDYVSVDADSKETPKAEADEKTQKALEAFKEIRHVKTKVGDVKTEGNETTAEVTRTAVAIVTDEKGADHELNVFARMRDTWVKNENGWRIKRSQEIDILIHLFNQPAQ